MIYLRPKWNKIGANTFHFCVRWLVCGQSETSRGLLEPSDEPERAGFVAQKDGGHAGALAIA